MLKKILSFSVGLLLILSSAVYAQTASTLLHGNDPVAGNPRGNITIVEFFDYQCSHCIHMAPVISAIIKNNPDVRIVFKEYPIRGPLSEFASRAALASNLQGKYYSFNHALLTSNEPLTQTNILTIAKQIGLNISQLKKAMYSNTVNNQLRTNQQLAQQLKIQGTPAFYFAKSKNSQKVTSVLGSMTQSDMQKVIDHVRQQSS